MAIAASCDYSRRSCSALSMRMAGELASWSPVKGWAACRRSADVAMVVAGVVKRHGKVDILLNGPASR
jgi:hypothetical protein